MSRRSATGNVGVVAGLVVTIAMMMTAMPVLPASADDHFAVDLEITAFTGVLGPGSVPVVDLAEANGTLRQAPSDLEIRALIANLHSQPIDQLRLVVEIHPAATSRAGLHRTLATGPSTAAMRILDEPVRQGGVVATNDIAGVRVRLPSAGVPWAPEGGVHPVRIAVVRGTEVLNEVTTAVVWLPEPPMAPVRMTTVWPLDSAPARQLGGVYDVASDVDLRPGGRLDRLLTAIERSSDPPIALAPAAHLLDELRDRANGFIRIDHLDQSTQQLVTIEPEDASARLANDVLQRIRSIARTLPSGPLTGIYARADLDALTASGVGSRLQDMATSAATDGTARLADALEVEPDATTFLATDPLTPAALDLLPVEQVLLPHNAAVRASDDRFDTVRPVATPSGRTMRAVVADPYLSTTAITDDDHGTVITVQKFLTSSAMMYFQAAGTANRVVLVMPPPSWEPTTATATRLLEGINEATWITAVTPDQLVAEGRRSARAIELSPTRPGPGLSPSFISDLEAARQALDIARAITPEGMALIGGHTTDELEDGLLKATSRWLVAGRTTQAEALIDDVRSVAEAAIGTIEVSSSRVTLTSDTGMIPVALHRTSGDAIAVTVEVISPGRLTWPDGRRSPAIVLANDEHQSVSFATRALSTGTFPVTVRILDPSGRHELQTATLPVRSTAISRPALIVTGGLVALLIGFGAWRQGTSKPRLPKPAGDTHDRR
ncbi:MAG: hypothetical protein WD358_04490 [Nitriliruptoraceae bacterium]